MRTFLASFLAISILLPVAGVARADELSSAAVAQLRVLVECMKRFDSACIVSSTNMQALAQRGMNLKKATKHMEALQDQLRASGTVYSRFDVSDPGSTFAGDGKRYVLIPYSLVVEAQGQRVLQEAFFIGFSDDDGVTWKFLDGISATQENIRMFIPSYSGAPLPDRRMKPLEQ